MGLGQRIPPKITYSGDKVAAGDWVNIAKKRMKLLERLSGFQNLSQFKLPPYYPQDGVTINATKVFDRVYLHIHVDPVVSVVEVEEDEDVLDLRFFCRIGEPGAVEYDGFGNIIKDETRFYWIDFGALSGVDEINIYPNGDMLTVGNAILADVVEIPTAHTQTKGFSLSGVTPVGETVSRRVCAGYHFFAEHTETHDRIYWQVPSISTTDGTGANRFVANLDDGSMCWARALQWWDPLAAFNEGTGEMGVQMLQYRLNDEGQWEIVLDRTVGFVVDALSIALSGLVTSDVGAALKEPFCLAADVHSISEDQVVLSIPYQHQPALFAYDLDFEAGTFSFASVTEVDTMYRWKFTADGFEQYISAEYEYNPSTGLTTDTDTWTDVFAYSCAQHTTSAPCNANTETYVMRHDKTYTFQDDDGGNNLYTVTLNLSNDSFSYRKRDFFRIFRKTAAHTDVKRGTCQWIGYCSGSRGSPGAMKQMDGRCGNNTYWYSRPSSTSPNTARSFGNNIDYIYDTADAANGSIWRQLIATTYIDGSGSYRVRENDCTEYSHPNLTLFLSLAATEPAGYCDDSDGINYYAWAEAEREPAFTLDGDAGLSLGAISPGPVPHYYKGKEYRDDFSSWPSITSSSTSSVDEFEVLDGDTYDNADISSIRYLDDRTADDTHGLCIATKGNSIGDWNAVIHGEDGITQTSRDKLAELVAALQEGNHIGETELIYDIGLI